MAAIPAGPFAGYAELVPATQPRRDATTIRRKLVQTTLIDSAHLSRFVHFVDILAAVVFAVSGALVASRKGMDVLRHEIYVTASVLGACTYVGLDALSVPRLAAMTAGFLVTFGVRGLAIKCGWSLPVFRGSATPERWKDERQDPAGDA